MADVLAPGSQSRAFDLTTFLDGETEAWGVFEDRFGRMRRRFTVRMSGAWRDGVFVLEEHFVYDDGELQTKTWAIYPEAGGRFSATAADCVGRASGSASGDAISMTYRFRLKIQAHTVIVDFDDRIYRLEDGIALNRATISKWGVRLGELALVFRKVPARTATTGTDQSRPSAAA